LTRHKRYQERISFTKGKSPMLNSVIWRFGTCIMDINRIGLCIQSRIYIVPHTMHLHKRSPTRDPVIPKLAHDPKTYRPKIFRPWKFSSKSIQVLLLLIHRRKTSQGS